MANTTDFNTLNGTLWTVEDNAINFSLLTFNYSMQNYDTSGSGAFFDTYFSKPRFIVETVMAALSLFMNLMALLSSAHARNKRYTVYHILFINLCVCNAMSLTLSWITNNSLFFANNFEHMMGNVCKVRPYDHTVLLHLNHSSVPARQNISG